MSGVMRKGRSPLRIVNRHTVTLKVTGDQISRWDHAGRPFKRDVPAFLVFAADAVARYLREVERERSRPDPILFRREEKKLLEALVRAAKRARDYLPLKPFESPAGFGHRDPGGDLKRAVYAVEDFWERNGEAFGI
jgi:hypothetical protein